MFNDSDAHRLVAKQRQCELIAEAARERLARSVARCSTHSAAPGRRGRSPDHCRESR